MSNRLGIILLCMTALGACSSPENRIQSSSVPDSLRSAFNEYWYSGQAEISSYDLVQYRYGEYREGQAVIIFVTEDVHPETHVKLDQPDAEGAKKVKVMKMNMTRNFTTGIYPYSMMLSVFHPFDNPAHPFTLKASMSSQEWCGHVYGQLNFHNGHYDVNSHSYFEKEGDQNFHLEGNLLEDALWVRLKINPWDISEQEDHFVPGLFYSRASHQSLGPLKARSYITQDDQTLTYHLEYMDRKLNIHLESVFPYQILGWEEHRFDGNDPTLVSKGTLNKTIKTDYWTKNKTGDIHLRDSLGLPLNY